MRPSFLNGPSFLVSAAAVARQKSRSDDFEPLGTQPEFPLSFELEVDGTKDYAAFRLRMALPFEEYDTMKSVHLIIPPRNIKRMRVQRDRSADPIVQHALWPGRTATSLPDYNVVVIKFQNPKWVPDTLLLTPSDGTTPQSDRAELILHHFRGLARSHKCKIEVPADAFTDDQLKALDEIITYDLDPHELTKPSYQGYDVINRPRNMKLLRRRNSSTSSSDESTSSRPPFPEPESIPRSKIVRLRVGTKRKRPASDQASRSSDDPPPSTGGHLQQLEERLTQKMNAQWEEKVQRMLAETKDAILAEVDDRLNARFAEIRADIANKPSEPREGRAADLDRELDLKIENRLPSLKEELRKTRWKKVKIIESFSRRRAKL